jgi:hypothetical protein
MRIYALLEGNLSRMLRCGAIQVVVKITCCACNNHVNIGGDDTCREQQGKAESFFSRFHCLGTLIYMCSNRVPVRRVVRWAYSPPSAALATLSGTIG